MNIVIRKYEQNDIPEIVEIWNTVVEDANAFPQKEPLNETSGAEFFAAQTFTGTALDADTGEIVGMYILHPNNVGRCGHICNASYAVKKSKRGEHIGRALVENSLAKGKECGFRILQFNAVTAANKGAQALYEKLGFVKIGTVPEGYQLADGRYDDIILYYKKL